MAVKLSTGLRDAMLDGGSGGGLKGALNLGFINIYSGPQPISPDSPATGTLLGVVSVNAVGTGLTFEAAAAGSIAKTTAENWKFMGAATGTAGWWRFYPAAGNPSISSTDEARLDGSIGSSGADMVLSNVAIVIGSPNTIDVFQFTLLER